MNRFHEPKILKKEKTLETLLYTRQANKKSFSQAGDLKTCARTNPGNRYYNCTLATGHHHNPGI